MNDIELNELINPHNYFEVIFICSLCIKSFGIFYEICQSHARFCSQFTVQAGVVSVLCNVQSWISADPGLKFNPMF